MNGPSATMGLGGGAERNRFRALAWLLSLFSGPVALVGALFAADSRFALAVGLFAASIALAVADIALAPKVTGRFRGWPGAQFRAAGSVLGVSHLPLLILFSIEMLVLLVLAVMMLAAPQMLFSLADARLVAA